MKNKLTITSYCLHCGREIISHNTRKPKAYCSFECFKAANHHVRIEPDVATLTTDEHKKLRPGQIGYAEAEKLLILRDTNGNFRKAQMYETDEVSFNDGSFQWEIIN